MFEDIDDIIFWGMNIPKEVSNLAEKTKDSNKPNMTDNEFKAYCLGIENTISIMKQLLDASEHRDSITFYNPNVETTAEFTADELVNLKYEAEEINVTNYNKPTVSSSRDLPRGFEGDYIISDGSCSEAWIRIDGKDIKERG